MAYASGRFFITFLSLGFGWTAVSVRTPGFCSQFCVCDTWYELERASCTGRHLYSIHAGAGETVQALDLSNNSISSLDSFELMNAGLKELKYLNLSGNSISEINLNAFDGLEHLMVLDLSRNHLRYVLENTIAENRELRILKLSGNNFDNHVPKLRSSWLMTLSLDSCRIGHLPQDTFNELSNLRNLDLSNNLMIQIDSVTFRRLHFLRLLSLEGNPWSCNQLMSDLQSYLRSRNVVSDVGCDNKSKGENKFERMIIRPAAKPENYPHPANVDKTYEKILTVPRHDTARTRERNVSLHTPALNGTYTTLINDVSPYWFLAAGFILGSACGIFACYFWLTGKCLSCYPRVIDSERAGNDLQRLSLLSGILHFDDLVPEDTADPGASCPGTPPPPYREVMLRPSLYRCPRPNSTRNVIGRRERYT